MHFDTVGSYKTVNGVAYDTIDWLIKNVPNNNGRVGMTGTSYGGWLVTQALLEPHPALKAVSEQASPDDMFINDDFHHNGAFRLSYGFEYSALLETTKEKNTNFEFDQYDTYSWYLSLPPAGAHSPAWDNGVRLARTLLATGQLVPFLPEIPVVVSFLCTAQNHSSSPDSSVVCSSISSGGNLLYIPVERETLFRVSLT